MDDELNRVLVVLAHPDDPEFFCGATLAKWARQGKEIRYLLLTCGDKGSDNPDVTPESLCVDRQLEQRNAADVIGAKDIVFLAYHDGELVNSPEVRRDIVREIRRFKPGVIVTCDPTSFLRTGGFINHADHRTAGAAALDAVFPAAGNLMYFPELIRDEGLLPHNVKRLYIHGNEKPDTWVDISETLATKIEALKKHVSQIDTHDVDEWMHEWAAEEGKEKGIPAAEAYRVMILQREDHSDAVS